MNKLFEISNLRCSYDRNYREGISKVVLEIRDLVLPRGRKIFIVGESGIGKSTILEVLGLMNNTIVPQQDTKFLFYDKEDNLVDLMELWASESDDALSEFRLKHFNFIFQSTNLMRNFTAYGAFFSLSYSVIYAIRLYSVNLLDNIQQWVFYISTECEESIREEVLSVVLQNLHLLPGLR